VVTRSIISWQPGPTSDNEQTEDRPGLIRSVIGNAMTRGDVFGCLLAVVAFLPVLLAPGYCVGLACDLLGFRARPLGERVAWSVVLSFAVMPIAAVTIAKYASMTAVCWLAGLCGVAALIACVLAGKSRLGRGSWLGLGISAVWVLFVVLELVDVAVLNHLLLSVTIYDHALRTAFVDAAMRTGVPPANPLYWPGHAAPMRYYYFWYVVTAVAAKIAGVTARQALIASVVWAGFGLAAIVALYCRSFLDATASGEGTSRRRWPRVALALGLLAVTGLDILPAIAKEIWQLPADADMEWWSGDQVTSWLDSVIWVPHHVAALVCCLFGFLLVWMCKGQGRVQRVACAVVAGIAFASAFGLSIWVPLGFAMVMMAWIVWVLVWERESRPRVPVLLGAGLVAVLAALPYLHELRTEPAEIPTGAGLASAGNTAHFLLFAIRRIIDPDALQAFSWFADIAHSHPVVAGTFARLILLLPGYFVELGFFGLLLLAVAMAMRRLKLDESARHSMFLVAATLIMATFLRSAVISSNDFGWRSMLIAQFFLLLLAVRWFEGAFGEPKRWVQVVLYATLWIGVVGTVYQQAMLRFYLPEQERIHSPEVTGLSEYAMALRLAFDEADKRIPKAAIIQFDTSQPSDYFRFAQVLHAQRQIATAFPWCASVFGGSMASCQAMTDSVDRLYQPTAQGGAISAGEARQECAKLGVGYVVATRWDGPWPDSRGWVWELPEVAKLGNARVVDCR
jgi:hypothetical protein